MPTRNLLHALGVLLLLPCATVTALPINITAQLTGDIRDANPDLIIVNTTITTDTTSNIAHWVVTLDNSVHTSIKLGQFYFNMWGAASDYGFSAYAPSTWNVSPLTGNVPGAGAGNSSFLFVAKDSANGNQRQHVTGATPLSFTMTKLTGNFTWDDFLLALPLTGADAGEGRLGAHLQSLNRYSSAACGTPNVCTTDSGFAFGNYSGEEPRVPPGGFPVPEPGVLMLLGVAGLAASWRGKRWG